MAFMHWFLYILYYKSFKSSFQPFLGNSLLDCPIFIWKWLFTVTNTLHTTCECSFVISMYFHVYKGLDLQTQKARKGWNVEVPWYE